MRSAVSQCRFGAAPRKNTWIYANRPANAIKCDRRGPHPCIVTTDETRLKPGQTAVKPRDSAAYPVAFAHWLAGVHTKATVHATPCGREAGLLPDKVCAANTFDNANQAETLPEKTANDDSFGNDDRCSGDNIAHDDTKDCNDSGQIKLTLETTDNIAVMRGSRRGKCFGRRWR